MKISELIKLHGVPVKVTRPGFGENDWVEMISDKRTNGYPCFLSTGSASSFDDYCDDWVLYVEKKPKKKLLAYMVFVYHEWSLRYGAEGCVFSVINHDIANPAIISRAPQFDCEIDG